MDLSRATHHLTAAPERADRVVPPATPDAVERILDDTRAQLFGFFIAMRLAVVPAIVALLGWVAVVDPAPWRRLALASLVTLVAAGAVWEHLRLRRRAPQRLAIGINLAAVVAALVTGLALTGGLASPLLPAVVAVALLAGSFASRALAWTLASVLVAAVAIFAMATHGEAELVPEAFRHTPTAGLTATHPWTLAAVTSLTILAVTQGARRLRHGYAATLRRAASARDESLRLHADHARALTILSGAIAHELKNPLASVKGLAALLAKRAEGKDAERLAILRREVDRMGDTLQELLDFARPAVPLDLRPTDLVPLVEHVAQLHEGLARQRAATVRLVAPARAVVDCDRRKVEQILVNLLQNALDASPAGGAVWIRVELGGALTVVAVEDEGSGIDGRDRERIFEPGVTDKPHGTGFGLPVARGLARQHGGDLVASTAPGGGARMQLLLPARPAADPREEDPP